MDEEVRWYKGPPSLAITEHWNYDDTQGFLRRLLLHEPGPAADRLGQTMSPARAASGASALRDEMENYNHQVGLKIVGEMLPQERNRVTLADDKDQYGLPIARVTYLLWRQRQGADRSMRSAS